MATKHIHVPELNATLSYRPREDILGSGTVGQVFRARIAEPKLGINEPGKAATQKQFALKEFLHREGRDDFRNERSISDALEPLSHAHILTSLASWVDGPVSYMLFPLADCDLYHFLRESAPPQTSPSVIASIFEQALGLCDALRCLHNYEAVPRPESGRNQLSLFDLGQNDRSGPNADEPDCTVPIGFHHDLKTANILLFGTKLESTTWKLCDFGSGTVKSVHSSSESIYNRKASTGDPVYSAPEYLSDGQVSRPKDIWSLGCIFLEVLSWLLGHSTDSLERFETARRDANVGLSQEAEPTFWSEVEGGTGTARLNTAVVEQLKLLGLRCKGPIHLEEFRSLIQQMLTLDPRKRPRASEICLRLESSLQGVKRIRSESC